MSESILLINTMQIHQGELEDFKESVQRSIKFVETNGPQCLSRVHPTFAALTLNPSPALEEGL
jgi:hypothetical protein